MKKYILFFVGIGLIIGTMLLYSAFSVQKNKKVVFSESGYILNGSSERYYFNQDEKYTNTYDDKISFLDTEGIKVTVDNDNFLHYSNGNIVGLQDSVLLIMNKINDDPIVYYNVGANKEIKKLSNRFVIKNLNDDIQFEQGISKISPNKYIVLADNIKIELDNGTTKEVKDYIEIEYFDNEIVNIYNQEISFQTISVNSYIVLNDNIRLNLGTKIISKDDVNRMSLEDMVINSDDNVTLIDINKSDTLAKNDNNEETQDEENVEEENEEEDENEIQQQNNNQGGNVNNQTNNSTTNNTNNDSSVTSNETINNTNPYNYMGDPNDPNNPYYNPNYNHSDPNSPYYNPNYVDQSNNNTNNSNDNNNNTNNNSQNEDEKENKIEIETPEIIYQEVDENETVIDETIALKEPVFKFENFETNAVGVVGTIQIYDEDELLSKDDPIIIKITNNNTGRTVYMDNVEYGTFSIPLNIETLMPNSSYTINASANYEINDNMYSKNFLYKTFVTDEIGTKLQKEIVTDKKLIYSVEITDESIESVEVSLLDAEGNAIPNRTQTIRSTSTNKNVIFDELESNTDYTVKLSRISYNGLIQEGDNWEIVSNVKTLKTKVSIEKLNYVLNKREGTATLCIDEIKDKDESIQGFEYVIYKYIVDENNNSTAGYDLSNVVYHKESKEKQITVPTVESESEDGILRNQYYGFKVIVTTFDNEKYVETESNICGVFALNGVSFPSVKFEKMEDAYPATHIYGKLHIIDNDNTMVIDRNNPLIVTYSSEVQESKTCLNITSIDESNRIIDNDGNSVIELLIDVGGSGNSENGLKSDTTYNFSVYGTIDLRDGNDQYKNAYVGGFLVTTAKYNKVMANLSSTSASGRAFQINLNLEGSDIEKESLSSIDIMLYEGSGDINSGGFNSWSRTITKENFVSIEDDYYLDKNKEVNSLQDLLFDNTLLITPSFIAGGTEANYTEVNYQVVVTATIDGTPNSNKIPIEGRGNEQVGNTIYTNNETGISYSAAYIIVNTEGTTQSVNTTPEPVVYPIKNMDAERYGLTFNPSLDNDTFVGFHVDSKFPNDSSLNATKITYYAWDNEGNQIYDENGEPLIIVYNLPEGHGKPKAANFELKQGTTKSIEDDNRSGLHRGNNYFFSYSITYETKDIDWPMCDEPEATIKTKRTKTINADKQEPRFIMYPKVSNENSITYMYSCSDYDKALYYNNPNQTETSKLTLYSGSNEVSNNNEVSTNGTLSTLKINDLVAGNTYTLKYKKKINKVTENEYTESNLAKQLFEGIVNDLNININSVVCNDERLTNKVRVYITGTDINRVSAMKFSFNNTGSQVMSNFCEIQKDENNKYYTDINLTDMAEKNSNFNEFINRNVELRATAYFDSGIVGFDNEKQYQTYTNKNNEYLKLNETNNNLEPMESNLSQLYLCSEKDFQPTEAILKLLSVKRINNNNPGINVNLLYSPEGMKQNEAIIVQKGISEKEIEIDNSINTINIDSIKLGIDIEEIKPYFTDAKIKARLVNPFGINIDTIYYDIFDSAEDVEPNWNTAIQKSINVNNLEEMRITDLQVAHYYYLRFKYMVRPGEFAYLFDYNSGVEGQVYKFQTINDIGINNIKFEYDAKKYTDKTLVLSYDIDSSKSNLYNKTKYTFYNTDNEIVPLSNANISNGQIVEGSLVVTNSYFNTDETFGFVEERIKVNPNINPFEMGKNYYVIIEPITQLDGSTEHSIERKRVDISLKTEEPAVGLSIRRKQKINEGEEDPVNYIKVSVTIQDKDCVIYGNDANEGYGQYNLSIYKYTTNPNDKIEVKYYSSLEYSNQMDKLTVHNLKNQATNYSVYLKPSDVDFSYNYLAVITTKQDLRNDGNVNTMETVENEFLLEAIDNVYGVQIGSSLLRKDNGHIEAVFYDYGNENVDRINKIKYSIFNFSDETIYAESFQPEWVLKNDTVLGNTYYKTVLPKQIDDSSVYSVTMDLYVDGFMIKRISQTIN